MGQRYNEIPEKMIQFIRNQKIFFVGTATQDSRVNISPKGMNSFRVLNKNRVIWLNLTGSGNESAAHVQINPRMTIMFAAFEGTPLILRLYGSAKVVHINAAEWNSLYSKFDSIAGARQIFDLDVDLVQVSCGMAVPLYDYVEQRQQLKNWAIKQGRKGVQEYWHKNNQLSLDGIQSNIINKNIKNNS